jgi:hypothetical protein
VPGSLPLVTHQQAPGFAIEHQRPNVFIRRGGPAPVSVKFMLDKRHIGFRPSVG